MSFAFIGVVQEFSTVALYAVTVYIFLKYGAQKIKWHYIAQFLSLTWIVSIMFGLVPYFDAFGVSENYGFCDINEKTPLFKGYVIVTMVDALILLSVIIGFSVLTYFLFRKNVVQENVQVKKAIAKYLLYLNIAVVIAFISYLIPSTFSKIRAAFEGELGLTMVKFIRILMQLPSVITPIVAMIIFKPIGLTLKKGIKILTRRRVEEHDPV